MCAHAEQVWKEHAGRGCLHVDSRSLAASPSVIAGEMAGWGSVEEEFMTWLFLHEAAPTVPRVAASRGQSMLHCWVTCTLLFYTFCDVVGYLNR